jgi:hypothetical protein
VRKTCGNRHARVVLHGEHHLANERQRLAIVPQVALLALRHLLEVAWKGEADRSRYEIL